MTDRPITFSTPMVQALLAGQKTQTRRVLKPQPVFDGSLWHLMKDGFDGGAHGIYETEAEMLEDAPIFWRSHLPEIGDRLYVREAWSGPYAWRDMKPGERAKCGSPSALQVWYWADGNPDEGDWERPRPSIHMPRWASRLTLIVTDVRVQRLQDISDEDAVAEGCKGHNSPRGDHDVAPWEEFHDLWNSVHSPDAWAANPWVIAVSFDVRRGNIDAGDV